MVSRGEQFHCARRKASLSAGGKTATADCSTKCAYPAGIIIIIIIIFINYNWVVARWQWLFYMYTKHEIGYY